MNSLTSTPHSCISRMATIALVEMVTVQKSGLTPIAVNIVQPDGSSSLTKVCSRECQGSCSSWRLIKSGDGFSFILPLPSAEYPSCLQTTWASSDPQKSSHTVPHNILLNRSPLFLLCMLFSLSPCKCVSRECAYVKQDPSLMGRHCFLSYISIIYWVSDLIKLHAKGTLFVDQIRMWVPVAETSGARPVFFM